MHIKYVLKDPSKGIGDTYRTGKGRAGGWGVLEIAYIYDTREEAEKFAKPYGLLVVPINTDSIKTATY